MFSNTVEETWQRLMNVQTFIHFLQAIITFVLTIPLKAQNKVVPNGMFWQGVAERGTEPDIGTVPWYCGGVSLREYFLSMVRGAGRLITATTVVKEKL